MVDEKLEKSIRLLDIKLDKLRVKEKDTEEYETYEGVLDKPTLKTLYQLAKKNYLTTLYGVISTGKEANVYWCKKDDLDYAVKIYRTTTLDFKKLKNYIIGDPRFKKIKRNIKSLMYAWAMKEFKNLKRAFKVGVRVPEPIIVKNNVLIMEYVGEEGRPAPLIKNVQLDNPEEVYEIIVEYIKKLCLEAKLIHADLSEFNILYLNEPVIIDMSQSLLTSHPFSYDYLLRDIRNVNKFFSSLGVKIIPEEQILNSIVKRLS
ncbi:MAG: serine protein kinase RIO [Candidatus Odinarchaeia archaeon]